VARSNGQVAVLALIDYEADTANVVVAQRLDHLLLAPAPRS
jgi:hypothetical protein